ncbi:Uncharacterized protein dnm_072620 [Desulfonema magnum]|uniref:Uncharacterized protein n=1 Tax=Desulfonema magnum TaxID=45655 RepID=A0A975GRR5_9BACT|nr:Uncharacterized protein dnm_072620 [Desulfonema magnum]
MYSSRTLPGLRVIRTYEVNSIIPADSYAFLQAAVEFGQQNRRSFGVLLFFHRRVAALKI